MSRSSRALFALAPFAFVVSNCNPSSSRGERAITPASASGLSIPEAPPEPAFPTQRADVTRRVMVEWRATVVSGPGLTVGSACTLAAALDRTGTRSLRTYLDLECGATTVYRPVEMGVRRVERDCQIAEQSPTEGAPSRLALLCQGFAPGNRDAQRIWVDTIRGVITVSDFEHQQTFEFHVEPFTTGSVAAPALTFACRPPTVHNGRVTEATPTAPMPPGAQCTIATSPCDGATPGVPHCRAEIRCGNVPLYGGGAMGRIACESSTAPQRALDNDASPIDGDPRLELDIPSGRVTVSDTTSDERWSVTIGLD
jgi:hypothetical protein